jgi:hypothetical protein
MTDIIKAIEPASEHIGRQRIDLLERRVDQAHGIISAVLAGMAADTLDHESTQNALAGALDLLTV